VQALEELFPRDLGGEQAQGHVRNLIFRIKPRAGRHQRGEFLLEFRHAAAAHFRESLARASGSIASNGGGRRSLLALTDLSSQARRHHPALPAARAKPVMLAMFMKMCNLSGYPAQTVGPATILSAPYRYISQNIMATSNLWEP
jgi:hypothetical protein